MFTSDLYAMGYDRNSIRAVTAGLVNIERGAWALTHPRTPEQRHFLRTVALLRTRPSAIAVGVTAAVVHELPLFDTNLESVHLRSPTSARTSEKLRVHRGSTASAVRSRGVRVTPLAETLMDCARTLPLPNGVALLDSALHAGGVTVDGLREHPLPPRTGVSRARRALSLADSKAESVGETRTRLILREAGIAVTPQVVVRDRDGEFIARVDLMVDGFPVVVEFDGEEKYRDDPAGGHWHEKLRDERLNEVGFLVVHVRWAELEEPGRVVAKVRRAMQRVGRLAS